MYIQRREVMRVALPIHRPLLHLLILPHLVVVVRAVAAVEAPVVAVAEAAEDFSTAAYTPDFYYYFKPIKFYT